MIIIGLPSWILDLDRSYWAVTGDCLFQFPFLQFLAFAYECWRHSKASQSTL